MSLRDWWDGRHERRRKAREIADQNAIAHGVKGIITLPYEPPANAEIDEIGGLPQGPKGRSHTPERP